MKCTQMLENIVFCLIRFMFCLINVKILFYIVVKIGSRMKHKSVLITLIN